MFVTAKIVIFLLVTKFLVRKLLLIELLLIELLLKGDLIVVSCQFSFVGRMLAGN